MFQIIPTVPKYLSFPGHGHGRVSYRTLGKGGFPPPNLSFPPPPPKKKSWPTKLIFDISLTKSVLVCRRSQITLRGLKFFWGSMPQTPLGGYSLWPQLINFPTHKRSPPRKKSCMKPWLSSGDCNKVERLILIPVSISVYILRLVLMPAPIISCFSTCSCMLNVTT